MASLVQGVAKLNPFKKSTKEDDDEDKGEEVDVGSVAGGGHSARETAITKGQLRISPALRSFLINQNVISEQDAEFHSDQLSEPLKALLDKPHVDVPAAITDRSHPLPDYFISSSHNTYLMAHQLYGGSNATAYEAALNAGARCVEIDAVSLSNNLHRPSMSIAIRQEFNKHIPSSGSCLGS